MTKHLRSCLTKHIRWSHDKTFTFMFDKEYTFITMKKSWQNMYAHYDEEIMKIHEVRKEVRKEVRSHLNIIFGSFTLITMKKFRQIIYVHVWQNMYAHYDEEIMTKHVRSLRWRNHDKTFTLMFDKAYTLITMKKSWKFMRWEKRWEKRWDLT